MFSLLKTRENKSFDYSLENIQKFFHNQRQIIMLNNEGETMNAKKLLTKKRMSKMERHLRRLAKLGLSSTSFLLNTKTQAMFPTMQYE